jgi:hypothetical protein
MKRLMIIAAICVFTAGCSHSPLDRLKHESPEDSKSLTDSDKAYWEKAAKENTADFKDAVSYCKGKSSESQSCFYINNVLNVPDEKYGAHALDDPY